MTTGTSGSYAINGTNLLLQPTEAGWVDRPLIGISGNGRATYPGVREFEMTWGLMDMASFNQIQAAYYSIQSTGTLTFDLPKFNTIPYTFYSYAGCTILEPTVGKFFEQWVTDVKLTILQVP
jgi:hypothetical protein